MSPPRPKASKHHCQDMYPLHFAAATGDLSKIRESLRKNIPINIDDKKGSTPLHVAVTTERLDFDQRYQVCKYLIDRGANIEIEDRQKFTPLNYARRIIKQEKFLNMMVSRRWKFVQQKISTPSLFKAVKTNDLVSAKMFLDSGADPNNTRDCTETISILSQAVKNNNIEMVKLLLSFNVNVNDAEAISLATYPERINILKLLFECDVNMNILISRLSRRVVEIFENLLKPDESLQSKSQKNFKALDLLIENGFPISNPFYSKIIKGERVACCFISSVYTVYSKIDSDIFTAESLSKYPAVEKMLIILIRQVVIVLEINRKLINEATLNIIESNAYTKEKFDRCNRQIQRMKNRKVLKHSKTTYFHLLTARGRSLVNHCSEKVLQTLATKKLEKMFPDYAKRLQRNIRRGSLERNNKKNFKQELYEIFKEKLSFDLICCVCDFLTTNDFTAFALRKDIDYYNNLETNASGVK